jgi:hypothetical protein
LISRQYTGTIDPRHAPHKIEPGSRALKLGRVRVIDPDGKPVS